MARTDNLSNFLTDVATAIKNKKGSETSIPAVNFDTEIINLPSGGTYQDKSVTIVANGTQTITPDMGYDAINELEVTTQVPQKQLQTKSYTFNQNATLELLPDTGYDGFNQVNLEIDVTDSEYATNLALSEQILGPVILPYTELQYLRSNNGWIILPHTTYYNATKMEFVFAIKSNGAQNIYFQGNQFGFQTNSSNIIMFRRGSTSDVSTGVQCYIDVPIKIKINPTQILVDDVVTNTLSSSSETNSNDISLPAFRGNNEYYAANLNIYSFKVYTDNILVHELIPVIKKEDNLVYLYDTIGEQYYRHSNFTAGPVKS